MDSKKNNKIAVHVGGRRLVLVSHDNEEYVKKIAEKVNTRIQTISKAYSQLDARGCAVMAALDFADDEEKAIGKKGDVSHQADKILRQADKQSKQIINLKREKTSLQNDYDNLEEKYKDLQHKTANLTSQYNELKKFLEKQIGNSSDKNVKAVEKAVSGKTMSVKTAMENNQKIDDIINKNNDDENIGKGYIPLRQYSLFDDEE